MALSLAIWTHLRSVTKLLGRKSPKCLDVGVAVGMGAAGSRQAGKELCPLAEGAAKAQAAAQLSLLTARTGPRKIPASLH